MSTKAHFYCQNLTGRPDFSIEVFNEEVEDLKRANVSEAQIQFIMFPPACHEQCFECMVIVGERRMKTEKSLSQH